MLLVDRIDRLSQEWMDAIVVECNEDGTKLVEDLLDLRRQRPTEGEDGTHYSPLQPEHERAVGHQIGMHV